SGCGPGAVRRVGLASGPVLGRNQCAKNLSPTGWKRTLERHPIDDGRRCVRRGRPFPRRNTQRDERLRAPGRRVARSVSRQSLWQVLRLRRRTRPFGGLVICRSPIDGAVIGQVAETSPLEIGAAIERARNAALQWRLVPAPKRGELVGQVAGIVRRRKSELAAVITLETGKIPAEAEGEVQEWIDICEFAAGLSRQLYGLTIASERPNHRMMEQWHPLGTVGIITAFNFPMAVWAWNAMLALVCGDTVLWKPSEKGALCAQAVQTVLDEAAAPEGLSQVIQGGSEAGMRLAESEHVPLVSATGSVSMGKQVAATVGKRLGRCLLELGGNNAAILAPSADLKLALPAIVFSAAGTAGQRCTTLRRLIVHESILPGVTERLRDAYSRLTIGDPRQPGVLVGPLIDE